MILTTKKFYKILTDKQKRHVIVLVCMMLVGGLFESFSVSLILPLISGITASNEWGNKWYANVICDLFGIDSQKNYICVLIFLLIAIFVVKNLYLMLEYNMQYGFIARSRYELQRKLIHKYTNIPYKFYLNANSGEIIRVLSNDTFYTFTLLTNLLGMYTEIIVSIILVFTIIVISPQIALWLSAFLIVEVLLIWKVIKPIMRREGKKLLVENGASNLWALQIINGIKSIKVTNTEEYFEQNYNHHAYAAVDASRNHQTFSVMPRLLIEAITIIAVLALIFAEVMSDIDLLNLIPQLSAFAVAAVRLLPSVNRISICVNQIPYYEEALDTVIKVLKDSESKESLNCSIGLEVQNADRVRITFNKTIQFNEIYFSYPNSNSNVLNRASFDIRKGESIGIVGASGAGKTTVVDIILGLLKPQSGKILVDGIDIETDMKGWLALLSYIPQNVFLIDDSIRKNVAFGVKDEDIREEEVWRALREAQMDEFVKSLPDGLDTGVGERGIRLSGGQCQRIGIARALYNNPEILFFDEATSALDNETEAAILEAIDTLKRHKTLVVIAHRLSTIKNCDVVYRVEEGKIFRYDEPV